MWEEEAAPSEGGGGGVCRCCLAALAREPLRADLLRDCFNITMFESETERPAVICEICIRRLQDASDFKLQVLGAQEMLVQNVRSHGSLSLPIKRRDLFQVWRSARGRGPAKFKTTLDSVRSNYGLDQYHFDRAEIRNNVYTLCGRFRKKLQSDRQEDDDFLKRYSISWLDEVENFATIPSEEEPLLEPCKEVKVFVEVKAEPQNGDELKDDHVFDDEWPNSDDDRPIMPPSVAQKPNANIVRPERDVKAERPADGSGAGARPPVKEEKPKKKRGRPRRGEVREGKKRKRPVKEKKPRRRYKKERLFGALASPDTEANEDLSQMTDDTKMKINAAILLQHSTIAPFRWNVRCKCFCCNTSFVDNALLHEHAGQHTSIELQNRLHRLPPYQPIKGDVTYLKCKICEDIFKDLDALKIHLSSIHEKKYYFDVNESIIPFKLTEEPYRCQVCYEVYHNYAPLNIHMNTHYKNFICEKCGAAFCARDRYTAHLKLHMNEQEHPCNQCKKIFVTEERLNFHIRHVHKKKVVEHRCSRCPATFKIYYHRELHFAEVHKKKLPEFECEFCHKKFNLKRALYIHKRRHLLEPKHECAICGKKFFNPSALQRHMFVHDGEKHFRCDVCDKAFARKYKLRDHLRTHTHGNDMVDSEQSPPTHVPPYLPSHLFTSSTSYNPLHGVGLFPGAPRHALHDSSPQHEVGHADIIRAPRNIYFTGSQKPDQER